MVSGYSRLISIPIIRTRNIPRIMLQNPRLQIEIIFRICRARFTIPSLHLIDNVYLFVVTKNARLMFTHLMRQVCTHAYTQHVYTREFSRGLSSSENNRNVHASNSTKKLFVRMSFQKRQIFIIFPDAIQMHTPNRNDLLIQSNSIALETEFLVHCIYITKEQCVERERETCNSRRDEHINASVALPC